jgi:hypothetical protein
MKLDFFEWVISVWYIIFVLSCFVLVGYAVYNTVVQRTQCENVCLQRNVLACEKNHVWCVVPNTSTAVRVSWENR